MDDCVGIVIAENAEQWSGHFLREIDRRHRAFGVEILRIVDDDIAAPTVDGGVNVRQRAGGEVAVAAAGAEADGADLAAIKKGSEDLALAMQKIGEAMTRSTDSGQVKNDDKGSEGSVRDADFKEKK